MDSGTAGGREVGGTSPGDVIAAGGRDDPQDIPDDKLNVLNNNRKATKVVRRLRLGWRGTRLEVRETGDGDGDGDDDDDGDDGDGEGGRGC